jgi:hypothetical protein
MYLEERFRSLLDFKFIKTMEKWLKNSKKGMAIMGAVEEIGFVVK